MNEVTANALTTAAPAQPPVFTTRDPLTDPAMFAHMQRVAKVYAASQLAPTHLQNKLPDVFIALQIALEMGENPIMVMQNIYFVSGRAGWKTEYMIARANKSGVFRGRIRWRSAGAGDDLAVTAVAILADTEEEEITATATMAMAKAEQWVKNPKYRTMPEHMLRWRSATMLIRLYAPEVMMGQSTADELDDMRHVGVLTPGADGSYAVDAASAPDPVAAGLDALAGDELDAAPTLEAVDSTPEAAAAPQPADDAFPGDEGMPPIPDEMRRLPNDPGPFVEKVLKKARAEANKTETPAARIAAVDVVAASGAFAPTIRLLEASDNPDHQKALSALYEGLGEIKSGKPAQ